MKRYAETGQHPGPLPTPGVFARHNAVDTPALLPDGTVSELSVSATLRARGTVMDSRDLVKPIDRTVAAIAEEETPHTTEDEE
jgi:NADH-quinone oxidoreductase subunit J